jgi:hypothetical protein
MNWQDVPGVLTAEDLQAQEAIARQMPPVGLAVTVGVGSGKSVAHLSTCLDRAGIGGVRLSCVFAVADDRHCATHYIGGLPGIGWSGSEGPFAAADFEDESIDALILAPEQVDSIEVWLPKLKPSGVGYLLQGGEA